MDLSDLMEGQSSLPDWGTKITSVATKTQCSPRKKKKSGKVIGSVDQGPGGI